MKYDEIYNIEVMLSTTQNQIYFDREVSVELSSSLIGTFKFIEVYTGGRRE